MKRISLVILSFILVFFSIKVYAYELNYSEWSETKPDKPDYLIESEERFIWYKENKVNIEYLRRSDFGDKKYDLNDYKLSEDSELLDHEPEESEDIIISSEEVSGYYEDNEIKKAKFSFDKGVYISEIIVEDNKGNDINYEIDPYYSILKDKKYDFIIFVKDLIITFDDKQDLYNLNVSFVYETNNDNNYLFFNYLTSDDNEMYEINYDVTMNPFRINNLVLDKVPYYVTKYRYKEKLYKTYDIEKEETSEYYSNYEKDYKKDETKKKVFYRFITNDYVILDDSNQVVKNPDEYCKKEYCSLVFLKEEPNEEIVPEPEEPKEEKEITINPKTIDNIYYYIILLIASLVFSIYIYKDKIRKIYLVMSKRFKRI